MISGRGIQPANFLLAPVGPEHGLSEAAPKLETSPFTPVHRGTGGFMFMSRTTIESMVWHLLPPTHQAHGLQGELEGRECHQLSPPQVEILQDSEQPFYSVPLPWGSSEYLKPGAACVLIFYPEGSSVMHRMKDIMREIETQGENDNERAREYRMIPFTNRDQGNLSPKIGGFWEPFCDLYGDTFPTPYFVVDQRTSVDRTLLAMEVYFYPSQDNVPPEALPGVRDPEKNSKAYSMHAFRAAKHAMFGMG
ncbi:hypothetical protein BDW69DRAFT_28290 [Aspergillus filifer]